MTFNEVLKMAFKLSISGTFVYIGVVGFIGFIAFLISELINLVKKIFHKK